jgi:3-oxoacyl-[acyl-carrier-protein] synthase II
MKRRVVVTGIGAVTSLGCKVEELWTRICHGESGVSPIERLNVADYRVRFGGEIHNWSAEGYIEPKDVKRFDRFVQFAQVSGVDAVRDSGIDFSKEDPWRCGVILGSGIGGLETIEVQHQRLIDKGPDKVSAFTIPKLIGNAASAQLSILYGLRGPNQVVVTACASATNAIGDSYKLLRDDCVDVVITGGSEAALTHIGLSAPAGRSTAIATASSSARAPGCWCSKNSSTPGAAARASTARSTATA